MFSLNLTTSNYARSYALQKSRSRSDCRVRRNVAKQPVTPNKRAEIICIS